MKKIYFIVSTVLLISSVNVNSQWYQRRYSVSDIDQLSQRQLYESFLRARGGTRAGILLSAAGAIGIGAGIALATHDSPNSGDIEGNVFGIMLLGGSIPMEITGLTIWGISGTRLQTIKGIMKNTKIGLGILNYPESDEAKGSYYSPIPVLSITFNF